MSEENESNVRDDVYSKAVRAGKRTYFFDVKSTRGNDLYLTITESKKRYADDGKFQYEKHKVFLYKEDFEKFSEGLTEAIQKIHTMFEEDPVYSNGKHASYLTEDKEVESSAISEKEFTDISFEDLNDIKA